MPSPQDKQESDISRGSSRKYLEIRVSSSYGGAAKAYCIGCNLSCFFCKRKEYNQKPSEYGKFMTPKAVASKLESVARENNLNLLVIGGGEPTLSFKHLVGLLEILSKLRKKVVIETNGILLGYDESYAKQLSKFKDFVNVKVSFKGATPEEFSRISGTDPKLFELQIYALKNLFNAGVPCTPSVMKSDSKPESIERLRDRLETISPSFYDIEEEMMPKQSSSSGSQN